MAINRGLLFLTSGSTLFCSSVSRRCPSEVKHLTMRTKHLYFRRPRRLFAVDIPSPTWHPWQSWFPTRQSLAPEQCNVDYTTGSLPYSLLAGVMVLPLQLSGEGGFWIGWNSICRRVSCSRGLEAWLVFKPLSFYVFVALGGDQSGCVVFNQAGDSRNSIPQLRLTHSYGPYSPHRPLIFGLLPPGKYEVRKSSKGIVSPEGCSDCFLLRRAFQLTIVGMEICTHHTLRISTPSVITGPSERYWQDLFMLGTESYWLTSIPGTD